MDDPNGITEDTRDLALMERLDYIAEGVYQIARMMEVLAIQAEQNIHPLIEMGEILEKDDE